MTTNIMTSLINSLGEDIINNLPQNELRRLKLQFKREGNEWNKNTIINELSEKYPELNKKIKKRKLNISNNIQTKKQKYIEESDTTDDYDYSDGFAVMDESDDMISEKHYDKLEEIKMEYSNTLINMNNIIEAKFNNTDTVWFYKNFKRHSQLEGKEKYDLEDIIHKRYKLLRNLQSNNMYDTFKKDNEQDISNDILNSQHSNTVKNILLNRMLNASEESKEEYQKALTWMNTILSLPTTTKCEYTNISDTLTKLHNHLKLHLYGMDDIIYQILQAVCVILTDPDKNGYILTFSGPPGVGKTTISSLISEAIGMGFGQISCGSINDRATIMGHSSTYIGSKPGMITQIQINSGQLDNIILLDEMDKLPDTKMIPVLLQILDKTQNSRFKDEYCPEVFVDLSKVVFIISVNDLSMFDGALLDRLKIINIDGYDTQTKIHICSKHIIPKIMKRTSIYITIKEPVIKKCIEYISPNISGVRELERFFSDVYEKLLLIKNFKSIKNIYHLSNTFNIDNISSLTIDIINKLCPGYNI